MMREQTGIAVVGGGVVGCFIAYRLALEGLPVTIVEREQVGAGASGASAGNVQPGEFEPIAGAEDLNPLEAESLALFRRFLPGIKDDSGIDPMEHAVHYFYAATDDDEVAHTRAFATALQRVGLRATWIDGAMARTLEPNLSPLVLGGCVHQDCMQMDATRFVTALAKAAEQRGATVRRGEVIGLQRERSGVIGVHLRDGAVLSCDRVVLAMGAWTGRALSQWFDLSLPISPHGLQKLHVRPVGTAPACAVRWGGVNIVNRLDGLVHVGSKHDDDGGFNAHATEDGKRWLLQQLCTILPGFRFEVVEAGAGLAAWTAGRTPIMGPLYACPGVYLAVPSSNGFLLSAVLAHMLTELLVHHRQHPFLPRILPERILQSATPT
jgi:glycine oxidase